MGAAACYIHSNPHNPEAVQAAGRLARLFAGRGAAVYLDEWLQKRVGMGLPCPAGAIPRQATAVLSLGGDGTLLRVLPRAARLGIPVLGINLGRIGFLLEVDREELDTAVRRLMQGEYRVEERMMLRCRAGGEEDLLVMNDVALSRGKNPGVIEVRALTGEELIFVARGDGVLVSTPTGTTGYALSAGGPVVYPTLESLTVVPVCSHVVSQRPIILPPDREISLCLQPAGGVDCQLILDGIVMDPPKNGRVYIAKAPERARFIRFGEQHFLKRLRQKQAQWSSEQEGTV